MLSALIDIGSNTVRLAVYHIKDGKAEMVLKKKNMLGLAAHLEKGALSEEGVEKLINVLLDFRRLLRSFNITDMTAFATAALRNATNSKAVVTLILARTSIPIRILSGDDEATYDFIGATYGQKAADGVLIDVGGGSTEVVIYEKHFIKDIISLPVGSLTFYKKYVNGLLPTLAEIKLIRYEALKIIENQPELKGIKVEEITGIGGTMKGLAALCREISPDIERRPSGDSVLKVSMFHDIMECYRRDRSLTEDELVNYFRAAADRLHTLIPGLAIVDSLAGHFGAVHLLYRDSGVREGYIYREILKAI